MGGESNGGDEPQMVVETVKRHKHITETDHPGSVDVLKPVDEQQWDSVARCLWDVLRTGVSVYNGYPRADSFGSPDPGSILTMREVTHGHEALETIPGISRNTARSLLPQGAVEFRRRSERNRE